MPSDPMIFAGVRLSAGRKPVIFAVLDNELNVASLESWSIPEALSCLKEYENMQLAIDAPSLKREEKLYIDFKRKVLQVGFKPSSRKSTKELLETNAQGCFRALIGQTPLPRRTLEGRLQRSAILYEQGLQITDPMEIFEEITRYKLVQGILPLENLFSSGELDALVTAYLAWMAVNRPGQIVAQGEFVLPESE